MPRPARYENGKELHESTYSLIEGIITMSSIIPAYFAAGQPAVVAPRAYQTLLQERNSARFYRCLFDYVFTMAIRMKQRG